MSTGFQGDRFSREFPASGGAWRAVGRTTVFRGVMLATACSVVVLAAIPLISGPLYGSLASEGSSAKPDLWIVRNPDHSGGLSSRANPVSISSDQGYLFSRSLNEVSTSATAVSISGSISGGAAILPTSLTGISLKFLHPDEDQALIADEKKPETKVDVPLPRPRPLIASVDPTAILPSVSGATQQPLDPAEISDPITALSEAGQQTAVYDIEARTVYLPNGERLEAHSGLGDRLDDIRYVNERMRGPTPPQIYDLRLRESLFHGVQAVRLTPADGRNPYGRTGLLVHNYLLGPNGDSNGCISIRDYDKFLSAFSKGQIKRLVVVSRLKEAPPAIIATKVEKFLRYALGR